MSPSQSYDDYHDDESIGYSSSYPYPNDLGYGDEMPESVANGALNENKPRILLMGLRRSGKSSIQKVVFNKMSPNETLFLESTSKVNKSDISNSSFVQFQIWDFPGQIDFFDPAFDSDMIFGHCGALIFVIDAQDDYIEALSKLYMTVTKAYKVNPAITFEVFIHKVDGLSDDHKIETQRDIHQRTTDELQDSGLAGVHLSFHLTSIYDHSIFEAFSKVIQKLIPQLPTLENLLNVLCSNSGIEKAFLFDIVSKIYIATDSSPVDMQTYELCSDMIDVVIDVSSIYGTSPIISAPTQPPNAVNGTNGGSNGLTRTGSSSTGAHAMMAEAGDEMTEEDSSSLIKLNNGMVLYLREVNRYLALICLSREENFEKHGLIDYNFQCFKKAIIEVFEVRGKRASALRG